jgi:hypothetical protein
MATPFLQCTHSLRERGPYNCIYVCVQYGMIYSCRRVEWHRIGKLAQN